MDIWSSDRIILREREEGAVERWLAIWLNTCICFYIDVYRVSS